MKIPFEFAVSDRTFQAGQYTLLEVPLGVSIQDESGETIATVLATNVVGRVVSGEGQIIFHCYNDSNCFLSEVWMPTKTAGRQLFISGSESDAVANTNQREVAVLGQTPEK